MCVCVSSRCKLFAFAFDLSTPFNLRITQTCPVTQSLTLPLRAAQSQSSCHNKNNNNNTNNNNTNCSNINNTNCSENITCIPMQNTKTLCTHIANTASILCYSHAHKIAAQTNTPTRTPNCVCMQIYLWYCECDNHYQQSYEFSPKLLRSALRLFAVVAAICMRVCVCMANFWIFSADISTTCRACIDIGLPAVCDNYCCCWNLMISRETCNIMRH